MLACSFKTAAELGLNYLQHDALIQVLHKLERGELHDDLPNQPYDPAGFSMRGWCTCICNHANRVHERAFGNHYIVSENSYPATLYHLFCKTNYDLQEATAALRDYLVTGEVH